MRLRREDKICLVGLYAWCIPMALMSVYLGTWIPIAAYTSLLVPARLIVFAFAATDGR